MLGLKYVGNREEGISLLLYRSYKTVSITPRKPYEFTPRDNVSLEARHYYEGMKNLGINIVDDPAELGKASNATNRTQKLEAETDVQVDVQTPIPSEEDKLTAEPTVTEAPQAEVAESAEGSAEVGETPTADASLVSEMSDAELSEYLEMNYDKNQLKTLISDLGVDITVGRKSESTLISELVNNHKAELVAHLAK